VKSIGNAAKDAKIRAVASGAISNGDTVTVNSDGTVSVVGGASQSIGSAVKFNAGITDTPHSTFDSNAGKIVVAYRDESNSDYVTAIVGTVSGTSISFGTEVVVESVAVNGEIPIVYDANAQKVVVFYYDSVGNSQKAKVGTVSGTSISFGSSTQVTTENPTFAAATYDANAQKVVYFLADAGGFQNGGYPTAVVGTVSGTSISFGSSTAVKSSAADYLSIAYDSNAQKVVVCWQDNGNSNYGTAAVGTVSGTSISFGSSVVFQSASTEYTSVAFDSNSNKVVVAYQEGGANNDSYAIVGTVSGTSISFGTRVQITTNTAQNHNVVYDSTAKRIVITYRDFGNSSYGTYVIGEVSGTSITLETPAVFETSAIQFPSLAFDSTNNKVVISYRGPSDHGHSIVLQVGYTNLTSDNFIGFADSGYINGQNVGVDSTCSLNTGQTGLTAGQKYYVQTDGSLSETAGDPSVLAGTAISSTEILVKG
jgi:hypothetical protein